MKNNHDDFTQTYFALRMALGSLALALPVLLFAGGWWLQGLRLQPSISAYYHSDMRVVFVGTLWAVGLGLIAYKGFSRREDWALNLGGALACCIAIFPMPPQDALACILPDCAGGACAPRVAPYDSTAQALIDAQLHFPAAIGFFALLGFVMIFCAHHTLHLVPAARRRFYMALYPALGIAFVGSMIAAFVLLRVFGPEEPCRDRTVFWVEVAGIVSFALYWFFKTAECALHDTDRRIPHRRRPHEVVPPEEEAPPPGSPQLPPAAKKAPRIQPAPRARSELEQWKALWRGDEAPPD
jgi:hypothetical protein